VLPPFLLPSIPHAFPSTLQKSHVCSVATNVDELLQWMRDTHRIAQDAERAPSPPPPPESRYDSRFMSNCMSIHPMWSTSSTRLHVYMSYASYVVYIVYISTCLYVLHIPHVPHVPHILYVLYILYILCILHVLRILCAQSFSPPIRRSCR
jgi:hypothetical protein